MGEVPTRKHTKWRNLTSDRESDGRFWIGKPGFLFEFPSNYMSVSLNLGDIRVWQTDNADHCYSWPPHCGGPANKLRRLLKCDAQETTQSLCESVWSENCYPQFPVRNSLGITVQEVERISQKKRKQEKRKNLQHRLSNESRSQSPLEIYSSLELSHTCSWQALSTVS